MKFLAQKKKGYILQFPFGLHQFHILQFLGDSSPDRISVLTYSLGDPKSIIVLRKKVEDNLTIIVPSKKTKVFKMVSCMVTHEIAKKLEPQDMECLSSSF